MVTTRKANALAHPGHVVLQNKHTRRTQKQVQEDNAATLARREDEEENRRSVLNRVAQLEDLIELEEQTLHAHSSRPDLCVSKRQPQQYEHDSEEHGSDRDGDKENLRIMTPPLSTELDDFNAQDDTGDTDNSEGESHLMATMRNASRKRPVKPKRGSLRSEITAARSVSGDSPLSTKRKMARNNSAFPKRLKRCDAMVGLLHAEEPQAGEFDIDEPEELLLRVEASKSSAPQPVRRIPTNRTEVNASSLARKTQQMRIRLSAFNTQSDTGSMSGDDLPLQHGSVDNQTWRKVFIPLLLAWAGSLEDPFSVNSQIHSEAAKLWARVFSEQLSQEDLSTVMRVAENTLNNWRSEMGKAGYRVVSQTFSNSNLFPHAVDREEYVADALRDLTFVYKHPDDKASRGAFCSRLVAEVYSQHLKKISGVSHDYGKQVGALALATAAAERGLTLFQTGEDALRTGRETDGRARGLGFTESAWGDKTRDLVKSTRKLQDSHWAAILGECSVFLHYHLQETEQEWCLAGEETEGFERVRPHAHIDITW
ncbi:hypothetical protein F5148DRAFT_1377533 [Russula earlei]|uniref:Uncharacterized protein n=2 Tax=Russula earlei TaxID=71964 RepID=A0ACC0U2G4_9AGAM|nr:hypothetical protein F5148DRAFT_1378132 [Russula earlei]KAI9459109.1 hypothetical protein F5148DRAFT_1377533 [Russula earlei]